MKSGQWPNDSGRTRVAPDGRRRISSRTRSPRGAFVNRQRQRVSKKFLRSRGHKAILHSDGAAQPRAAPDRRIAVVGPGG